ncbi:MAG: DUF192 domain-containing protein [Pseudomonadota bacterium]
MCWTVLVSSAALAQATCAPESVFLRGDWGTSRFSIEIADDPAERARGLMHRESLPTSAGMLFIYEAPQPVSFWMRNTLIPLDILFVDATGVVQHIHHQAQPLDETPIPGGEDVFAVLEINGGLSRQLGISVGTQLRHPAFDALNPAWPCR